MMDSYTIRHEIPSVETYCKLREITGLSKKATAAAAAGLPKSLFAVQITYNNPKPNNDSSDTIDSTDDSSNEEPIAMGRVIGDGALWFTVVDIAVHPAHQGQGLGFRIMKEVEAWLKTNVPKSGQVNLVADGRAKDLYHKFGWRETAPYGAVAMARLY
ncbi:hypothetical protein HWV62_33161 [Athelia sp. TMB]|nr:hypothetical protein HWV62_33161 [Athelia sp. TMB]